MEGRDSQPGREGQIVAEKFRIERVLGEGGMGIVYLALHCDLEQPVAIKIIRDELLFKEDLVERMLQEARTAAQFRSEHIARVLDVGRLESGAPYLVMEYLEGADLARHLLDRGPMLFDEAVSLVLQCCEALAEAHVAGIIHRDIKPENLFLTTRADGAPIIKVLDFGISKNVSSRRRTALTNPNMIVGSPDYMSPEQMHTREITDERADIWSLGAVLYELVTGHVPFEAPTVPAVCARVLADDPIPPRARSASIPAGLETVILRCLHKERDERYPTVADLACALAPYGRPGSDELAERTLRVLAGIGHRHRSTPHDRPSPIVEAVPLTRRPTTGKGRWAAACAIGVLATGGALYGWAAGGDAAIANVASAADLQASPVLTGVVAEEQRPAASHSSVSFVRPVETIQLATASATERPRNKPVVTRKPEVSRKPAPSKKTSDAWDPSSFGGRR